MKLRVKKSRLKGQIAIPGSKSHTIRGVNLALLADGQSRLISPLDSADTRSALNAVAQMGAEVTFKKDWTITGTSGQPHNKGKTIDVGNSGTSLRFLTAAAALSGDEFSFDGDSSIRQRPMGPLLQALEELGAEITSTGDKCPLKIRGPVKSGKITINGFSSQYISALLMICPLLKGSTEIIVTDANEKPYLQITLDWLKQLGIICESRDLNHFYIQGEQSYKAFERRIPADFSSATFSLAAAAITSSSLSISGLDFDDPQGDKAVFDHFQDMGIIVNHNGNDVLVSGEGFTGREIDLNSTPDALPAMAAAACFANGETSLRNVVNARKKECDRIAALHHELSSMGADIDELEDGLVIRQSSLKGAKVKGYNDHRIIMALAIAGMGASGETVIDNADAVNITYPGFIDDMKGLGADMKLI